MEDKNDMPLADLLEGLKGMGAILFGRNSCEESQKQRRVFGGTEVFGDAVQYIACDGNEQEQRWCREVGIQDTPLMIIGGMPYHGLQQKEVGGGLL